MSYNLWRSLSRERRPDVFPPILGVNTVKIISTRPDILDKALWRVINRIVILFPQLKKIYQRMNPINGFDYQPPTP